MKGPDRFDSRQFESASGLRPASAFVLIGFVLLAVSAKAAHIAFYEGGAQPDAIREESAPWPRFEIVDRNARPLAVSVECFDLTISPRAMWLAHTPAYMAERIASILTDEDPAHLLERMLPMPAEPDASSAHSIPEASQGTVRVAEPELLAFDLESARAVDHWIQTGRLDLEARAEGEISEGEVDPGTLIPGLWLAPHAPGTWTLEWEPALLLSQETRIAHLGGEKPRPDRWTMKLLRDLATLVEEFGLPESMAAELANLEGAARRRAPTDALWAELMSPTFRVVRRRIDPFQAHALSLLLADEAVSPWQMKLTPRLERRHPVRPGRVAGEQADESEYAELDLPGVALQGELHLAPAGDDSFAVLGQWGVLGADAALARARSERDRKPHLLDWEGLEDPVAKRAWELATRWRPESGLELSCAKELEDPRWRALLRTESRTYARRMRTVARDRRRAWKGRVPNYFESASDATDVPRFVTTLDAHLQQSLHEELRSTLERFDAALVMGIVLDVETGDVLAIDSAHAYSTSGFAPILHAFTPGSTFKPVIMSIALDQGAVTPEEMLPTHVPHGIVVRHGRSARPIREAEGAPEEEEIRAADGLAHSVNAVLVQIGLRVPAHVLRDRLVRLGYGSRPATGLGPETAGYVPPLERGTWSPVYTHASISFGHELTTSLWQHATAMATIVRGGLARPLRLIAAVEQEGERWDLAVEPGERVLSEQACAQVRAMMALGAREGTGDRVASPEHCPEFAYIGTKTGTTEKVPTELCLHVELAHQAEHEREGTACSRAHLKQMRGQRDHKGIRETCYTSSMCAVGRVEGSERALLAFVVVDEPRSREKFGADVAGLAAVRTLRRAAGLTPALVAPPEAGPAGIRARDGRGSVVPEAVPFNPSDMPWAESLAGKTTQYSNQYDEGGGFR